MYNLTNIYIYIIMHGLDGLQNEIQARQLRDHPVLQLNH